MKTIFKNTVIDVLKNRITIYTVILFSVLLMFCIGLKWSGTIYSGQTDLSYYVPLTFSHFVFYIFYLALVFNLSGVLEREIEEGFHEVSFLYISRTKYFFTKYLSFLLVSVVILFLSGVFGLILYKIFGGSGNTEVLWSFPGFTFNILFIISLIFVFSLSFSPGTSSFLTFFTFLLFSFLNSEIIVRKIFRIDKLSVIADIVPSVFKLQNEFLRFGLKVGFSDRFWIYLINIILYLAILFLFLFYKIKRYEYTR